VLYLAGSFGDPTYEAVVRTRIARELGDRVRLLGRITPDRVPAHLASADVVWVPAMATSQYGKPTVTTKLFEGMAVGLAALVSDLPGRGDIVTATQCGLAVPPTVEGHLGGLRALAADRAALGPMGARGRAAVQERYSWEVVQKHLVDFYAKLCKGIPRGTPTR
jgi:glycosyltransferase involved in cell wall biosynthesis